ncbi:hypothetical protein D3C71_2163400 [compost metagenome]
MLVEHGPEALLTFPELPLEFLMDADFLLKPVLHGDILSDHHNTQNIAAAFVPDPGEGESQRYHPPGAAH